MPKIQFLLNICRTISILESTDLSMKKLKLSIAFVRAVQTSITIAQTSVAPYFILRMMIQHSLSIVCHFTIHESWMCFAQTAPYFISYMMIQHSLFMINHTTFPFYNAKEKYGCSDLRGSIFHIIHDDTAFLFHDRSYNIPFL